MNLLKFIEYFNIFVYDSSNNGTCGLNDKFIYDIETCDYRKNKINICDGLVRADIKFKLSIS
jgi:hypothetical protein